jgi:hypothetical protein
MEKLMIRGSEVQSFLRCRKRWEYEYLEGLQPKEVNHKLFFGNLIHKFIEVLYSTGNAEKAKAAMFQFFNENYTTREGLLELYDLASKIADRYTHKYITDLENYTTIATELQFRIPLDENMYYTGTIDWIFLDEDERLCFADHKTTKSLDKYEKGMEMDRQISRYYWALQQLCQGEGEIWSEIMGKWMYVADTNIWENCLQGMQPERFMYNIILKDVPEEPKMLKNGTLSKDKRQRTTYDLYLKKLEELGLVQEAEEDGFIVPEEYHEILEHLKARGDEYFKRVWVTRLQEEIDAAMQEFYMVALDTVNVAGLVPKMPVITYRNINHDCSWDCAYRNLCIAEMDGSNASVIRSLGFEKKEDK